MTRPDPLTDSYAHLRTEGRAELAQEALDAIDDERANADLRIASAVEEALPYVSMDDKHGNIDIKELADLLARYTIDSSAQNARWIADMLADAVREQLILGYHSERIASAAKRIRGAA